jgi:hypothetical protein
MRAVWLRTGRLWTSLKTGKQRVSSPPRRDRWVCAGTVLGWVSVWQSGRRVATITPMGEFTRLSA